jgi:hypothetical protein
MGTSGTGCSRAGAVGGCQITSAAGVVTLETTIWYYTGTRSFIEQACPTGKFVSP